VTRRAIPPASTALLTIDEVATFLILESRGKSGSIGRSIDYTAILKGLHKDPAYGSTERYRLTAEILPEIARQCLAASLPMLSCLAVSSDTRKPDEWFRIFAVEHHGLASPRELSEEVWQAFVLKSQKAALAYWSAGRVVHWPIGGR
jgi:hypothetical protein